MQLKPVRNFSEIRLVNGSAGDPCLFIDYPGRDNALLFDAGDNSALALDRLSDLEAVFVTHHHVDHFIGLDRIVRANLDSDKTLSIYGPAGTIRKVYDRIKSYDYQYFPFQKIRLHVHEVHPGKLVRAVLECTKRFPEPEPIETAWDGPTIYEDDEYSVEATFADHTVPCLAFALVERTGYHPDGAKLRNGALRPGAWVNQTLKLLRSNADPETLVAIDGGRFPLRQLADSYFCESPGARFAYVTDTCWSESVKAGLLKLARRARRLYCDCFY